MGGFGYHPQVFYALALTFELWIRLAFSYPQMPTLLFVARGCSCISSDPSDIPPMQLLDRERNDMALLDVGEAAEVLNTSPRFVRRLIQERRIAFVKVGRHVRIKSTELDRFVADGEVSAVRRG